MLGLVLQCFEKLCISASAPAQEIFGSHPYEVDEIGEEDSAFETPCSRCALLAHS